MVVIRGEPLPSCRACKQNVRFEIIHAISHITHDWDFSGPHNLMVKPKHEEFRNTRMFRRINVQWPITFELEGVPGDAMVQGQSVDLSIGGMGAIIREKLPPRHKIGCVKILINAGSESLVFHANFRYQAGLRYGFEFSNVSAGEKETIRRLLETHTQQPQTFSAE